MTQFSFFNEAIRRPALLIIDTNGGPLRRILCEVKTADGLKMDEIQLVIEYLDKIKKHHEDMLKAA